MSQIQSSVGLVTGIPILDTVDQLIAISARPRDLLTKRTAGLKSEQLAIDQLSSRLLGLQFSAQRFSSTKIFDEARVSSSNTTALTATISAGATPAKGSYQFTPVQTAQAQQLLSSEFAGNDVAIGTGTLSFQHGGFVDRGVKLSELNDGEGVERGKIKITDRSGTSAVIDLRFVRTIDDVLKAITDDSTINVTAVADGNAIKLVDNTGESGSLIVAEVSGGTTASGLGLSGIAAAQDEVTGQNVLRLHSATTLATLNDGNGVGLLEELADLEVTLADGTTLEVDFADSSTTLGDLLETINAVDPLKLQAAVSADGARLELTDLTAGGGTFAVTSLLGGTAAEDLGLTGTAVGGVITGTRLQAGLKTSLLSRLHGGTGTGTLGTIQITDRSGSANLAVDLSSAETLNDIVKLINDAGLGVSAKINSARNGIQIKDTSGGAGNLTIANGDGTNSADALGIAIDSSTTNVNSGSLSLQTVSRQTSLSTLNRGQGVALGSFFIKDSNGQESIVKLNVSGAEAQTIGDVIDAINELDIDVTARINDTGDGIAIEDTGGGEGILSVRQSGVRTTAADLNLLGDSTDVEGTQTIDGTSRIELTIGEEDTLADVIESINALGTGFTASSFFTGQGYRISIGADATGSANEFTIDSTGADFSFSQISAARDALLLFGSAENASAGLLVESSDNVFENVVEGVNLTIRQAQTDAISVNVTTSSAGVIDAAKSLVASYNALRTDIDTVTQFDAENNSVGLLFGSRETLRIESDLANLITGRFFGVGDFQSLERVGFALDDKGKLTLDQEKLQAAFDADPASLQTFFTDEDRGVAAKLTGLIDQLTGADGSLLTASSDALQGKIKANESRIEFLSDRLDSERNRLLRQFYQMELVIGKLQNSLSALNSLQIIAPNSVNRS